MSSAGSSRLARLEQRLLSGLPLHKAAHLWTVAEIERFCEDPAARALVPDEDLARLLEELEALCAAEGIEPDELAEPTEAAYEPGSNRTISLKRSHSVAAQISV